MAAEIYQYSITERDALANFTEPTILERGLFRSVGFGDGSGHETFVMVKDHRVQLFSGHIAIGELLDQDDSEGKITVAQHIATLRVGEPHFEPLLGPENNNKAMLFVRNIGHLDSQPVLN